jgi:mRNA interferase MazF
VEVKRGDIFTVVIAGDYGKPRPAVIVQTDAFGEDFESVIVCPLTSFDAPTPDFRLSLEPSAANGLRSPSQVMIEKPITVTRRRIGNRIGRLEDQHIEKLNAILTFVMGLTD